MGSKQLYPFKLSKNMGRSSLIVILIILFFVVILSGFYYFTIVFTLLGSVFGAFIAFVVGNWVWKWFIAPKIRINIVEPPQTMNVCQPKQPEIHEGNYGMHQSDYFQPMQSTTNVSGTITNSGTGCRQFEMKNPSESYCQEIQIYVLEVINEGKSAARNSLLFFRINNINKICKWNSVPEPTLGGSQHFYDVYQRLTLLQGLSDRAAFVFRFSEDKPYQLRQYDLTLLYGSNPVSIEKLKQDSNMIDCSKEVKGELLLYSEDYQGKCSISFSYSEEQSKITISLNQSKTHERDGYRSIRVKESDKSFEIPSR
ncbi:hypothetical protein Thermo_00784 [Thermoplasmatales archaeon]|nr:hypothetical protein Thermo_00784 [Thermoplasmatales archaeon]